MKKLSFVLNSGFSILSISQSRISNVGRPFEMKNISHDVPFYVIYKQK